MEDNPVKHIHWKWLESARKWLDEQEKDRPIVPPYARTEILAAMADFLAYELDKEIRRGDTNFDQAEQYARALKDCTAFVADIKAELRQNYNGNIAAYCNNIEITIAAAIKKSQP